MFVGIDPSFTGTGVIILDEDTNIKTQKLITTNSKNSVEERLIKIIQEITFITTQEENVKVYLEGPSYSSNGAFALQMGALHYYIRIFLYKNNIQYEVIAPSKLKKFVTGKGNCKKELMLLKIFKKWDVEFEDNNLADAYALARMALEENVYGEVS